MSAKNKSYEWGLLAESMAVWYLRVKGYRILARRAKTPIGEIDIIAKCGNTLIAVEVKARKSFEVAAYSIKYKQQKRISKALELWAQHHFPYAENNRRYDAILIRPWGWPQHIQNAWQYEI